MIETESEDILLSNECLGMKVFDLNGHNMGTVIRVESYPANDVFVVDTGHSEIMIPIVKDFILLIDKQLKRIETARCDEFPEYPKGGI